MTTTLAVDRSRICTFTFNNGCQCRIPLSAAHPYLCTFHARKEAQAQTIEKAGNDIAYSLSTKYTSYCDLSSTLAHTISAVARRRIPTRTATTIAYLTQNLLQAIAGAQNEYIEAFGDDAWRAKIADNVSSIRSPKYTPEHVPSKIAVDRGDDNVQAAAEPATDEAEPRDVATPQHAVPDNEFSEADNPEESAAEPEYSLASICDRTQ